MFGMVDKTGVLGNIIGGGRYVVGLLSAQLLLPVSGSVCSNALPLAEWADYHMKETFRHSDVSEYC